MSVNFFWPEPKWVAVGQGQAMNPARVKAAFDLINGELVIGEQFQLIEMMLAGTEWSISDKMDIVIAALEDAHNTLHECTAILTASDCAKVAAVMVGVHDALDAIRGGSA